MEQNIVAMGYDAVFGATPKSPTLRRLWREHASGVDFPDEFSHISFVTIPQLELMASELRLAPEKMLVDLGCGMGAPRCGWPGRPEPACRRRLLGRGSRWQPHAPQTWQ
jgi:hypothetical protein